MNDTVAGLRGKIGTAGELRAVVRTMKAMAASSVGQYSNAVDALDAYYRTTRLALCACLARIDPATVFPARAGVEPARLDAIVFGSDQGMVGRFNDSMCEFVCATLAPLPGVKSIWAVGERIASRCTEAGLRVAQAFALPMAIGATAPLLGRLLIALDAQRPLELAEPVHVFHHRPGRTAAYAPVCQRLLPLDAAWWREAAALRWPTRARAEVIGSTSTALAGCIREFLFVSLFRACTDSQASENASRLAAMERAEKNIDDLLEALNRNYHRLRQNGIDAELFDLISGFEALPPP